MMGFDKLTVLFGGGYAVFGSGYAALCGHYVAFDANMPGLERICRV